MFRSFSLSLSLSAAPFWRSVLDHWNQNCFRSLGSEYSAADEELAVLHEKLLSQAVMEKQVRVIAHEDVIPDAGQGCLPSGIALGQPHTFFSA